MSRKFTCHKQRFTARLLTVLFAPPCLLLLLLIMMAGSAHAQTTQKVTITGLVADTSGRSLEGATISVNGNSSRGTATDRNGRFILDVVVGSTIQVTFVGFVEQHFVVNATRKDYNILLKSVVASVDEVVVTAFGRKQRKEAVLIPAT
jgi:hypothetical protein